VKDAAKSTAQTRIHARLRHIEGRHNTLVKELRRTFAQAQSNENGVCAIEGLRILEEALRSGLRFRTVFFSQSAENKAQRLIPQIGAHVDTVMLPDKLFATTVPSEAPQGVAALVQCKQFSLDDVLARVSAGPVLVIAALQDPGNLGTILRSAEAFAAAGVILCEGTVSPFNHKVVRASAGSIFRLPVVRATTAEVTSKLRAQGLRMIATSSHKGTPLCEATLSGLLGVFIGSEGAGLPKHLISEMDDVVAIPHSPKVESLNAGVAASIVLYEISRQRS
jgi:TrmH family RNA methyltransferase